MSVFETEELGSIPSGATQYISSSNGRTESFELSDIGSSPIDITN